MVDLTKPTREDMDELCAINLRNVPRSIRKRFKNLANSCEMTMQDAVLLLIEEALEKDSLLGRR